MLTLATDQMIVNSLRRMTVELGELVGGDRGKVSALNWVDDTGDVLV
jgi:hypothetical protein